MGFWNNVKEIMEFRDITRKELAGICGVSKYIIDKGIERNSDVSAVIAIKISRGLNIPLETLLEIGEKNPKDSKNEQNKKLRLVEKYLSVLNALEKMPKDTREKFIALATEVGSRK